MTVRSFLDDRVTLHSGDCVVVLASLPENSVDSVVSDPPYGLEFMGREWDGADGFRRSLNAADAGRDSVHGRTSRKAPEYRTAGTGRKGKPGIGARDTDWVSNAGWNQFRCGKCGHLFHGGSPCQCEHPQPVRADNRWNLFQVWCEAWARECLRVLKPGGHLVAFSGTRTYHRMVCAIEDAGFEIRDQLAWVYGSGMNKVGYIRDDDGNHVIEGWGGSLKPAWEPICLARKPLVGTMRANMEQYGTGAFNIDGCRIEASGRPLRELDAKPTDSNVYVGRTGEGGLGKGLDGGSKAVGTTDLGRWPANLVHDGSAEVLACFPDSPGQQGDLKGTEPSRTGDENTVCYGKFNDRREFKARRDGEASAKRRYTENGGTNFAALPGMRRSDGASAARFFYTSKADADDRLGSKHPTVKPVSLMRWLAKLVTPPGGTVLDPFAGTGTTGEAAYLEGMRAVLIEREPEYQQDIVRRMELVERPTKRAAVAKSKNKLEDPLDLPLFAELKGG